MLLVEILSLPTYVASIDLDISLTYANFKRDGSICASDQRCFQKTGK